MKLIKNKQLSNIVNKLKRNKIFLGLIFFVFILHLLTYPSIHHIADEPLYLNIGKEICQGKFSSFFGNAETPIHTPVYHISLCLTSFLHDFNLETAELVTFSYLILMVVCWYFSIPRNLNFDRKKFVLLLFSNSLLWIYSLRVLMDVPLAFFLSLGMLHLYLFFEYKKKTNYYLSFIFLSLAVMTKENALIYLPIFFFYILLKNPKNIKKIYLLLLPLIPYLIFTLYQFSTGYNIYKNFKYIFKATTSNDLSFIIYANLPVTIYMIGVFFLGMLSIIFCLINLKKLEINFKKFMIFFLTMYIIWELTYDFIAFGNVPRYNLSLIPFFSLIISESTKLNKKLKYIYYITLIYNLVIGFSISYFFHINITEIQKIMQQFLHL